MTPPLPSPLKLWLCACLTFAFGSPLYSADWSFADFYLAPVRVHLWAAPLQPSLTTTLQETDIQRILGKVNGIWSQAGVFFFVESTLREAPRPPEPGAAPVPNIEDHRQIFKYIPEATHHAELFNLCFIKSFNVNGVCFPKSIFVKDSASLRPVEGGCDEPIPRVTSHELGHAMGLPHRQDTTNLMASGTTGTGLNAAEIASVRQAPTRIPWLVRAPDLLEKADALQRQGKSDDARLIYRQLAGLPLQGEPLPRIRQLAAQ